MFCLAVLNQIKLCLMQKKVINKYFRSEKKDHRKVLITIKQLRHKNSEFFIYI